MPEPRRCAFCDEPLDPDHEGTTCDAGCSAGYSLFVAPDDDEDENENTIEAGDTLALEY